MTKQKIGYAVDTEATVAPDEQQQEIEEAVDLNDGLVSTANNLLDILRYYQKSIKGITIEVDIEGKCNIKIKY